MKKFSVVIGTNYGDEGKGLTTDWLASNSVKNKTIVARFSGGANAGHTVELDDGTRHVFSHISSGSFNGVPTLLTRDFVVNPILFWKEIEKFKLHAEIPPIFVDPRCRVTTPFDVMINQEKERMRFGSRHGSTGVGLNETVHRHEKHTKLIVQDLFNIEHVYNKLNDIKSYFEFEMQSINPKFDYSIIENALNRFMSDVHDFSRYVLVTEDEMIISHFDHVIFEGSQGLLLDEKSSDFPHVTRASTGVTNLVKYFENEKFKGAEIDLYYITRSYLTRHGAGPMPTENENMFFHDVTNQPNEFQGTLRFGDLDFKRMKREVIGDYKQLFKLNFNCNVVMTWYDDTDFKSLEQFALDVFAKNAYVATGKTRSSVQKIVL